LSIWLTEVQAKHSATSLPRPPKRNFFGFKKQLAATPVTPTSTVSTEVDNDVSSLSTNALDISYPAGLRIVHLRKKFKDDCVAVTDSSFVMQYGELLAILGANGSGKSTTCHVLTGITPTTAGDALIDDQISLLERHHRGQIGWCPQHDILFDDLTPVEHVHPLHCRSDDRFGCTLRYAELQRIRLIRWLRKDWSR
jgi:ABC-type glutathione transport system ATPase component